MTDRIYFIYQTQEGYPTELLWETYSEDIAEESVARVNSNLAAAGIPSSVSSCYYV
jgi:hypothetical protein